MGPVRGIALSSRALPPVVERPGWRGTVCRVFQICASGLLLFGLFETAEPSAVSAQAGTQILGAVQRDLDGDGYKEPYIHGL